jgi:hypothetical protein
LSEHSFAEITGQEFNRAEQDQRDDPKRDQAQAKPLQYGTDYWMHGAFLLQLARLFSFL